eukprot:CAMPEP_0171085430 /NCGR_PEP_ID=MMETSP0766_2-20121228/18935_2 /TAXON_ID=439317 /ORGANISM="Gambierdiscus australes, Strain CAWD 149" /LENGTH=80 /DNA_ID=CAMNT_0011543001 /DNA_START=264 /DNA_END=503 /DNA_ORIENTATION=-
MSAAPPSTKAGAMLCMVVFSLKDQRSSPVRASTAITWLVLVSSSSLNENMASPSPPVTTAQLSVPVWLAISRTQRTFPVS